MVRRLLLTPPTLPSETQCRGLVIPASQEWLGLFSEALSQTIYAHNYEQVHDTDLTPEATAAAAYEIYIAWLASECEGICPPPTLITADSVERRVMRKSPTTGRVEVLEADGTWIEPTGSEAVPDPGPRVEPLPEDRRCAAATNAANVLRQTYEQALADINADVDRQTLEMNIAAGLAAGATAPFFAPLAVDIAMTAAALTGFIEIGQVVLFSALWNDNFHDKLICILLEHAADNAGVVTFDHTGVLTDVSNQAWEGEYILLVSQVTYLLLLLGPQGLDLAGETNAVAGDCAHCGEWCYTFDFTSSPHNWHNARLGTWTSPAGSWNAGVGWVGTMIVDGAGARGINTVLVRDFESTITEFECVFDRVNGQYTGTIGERLLAYNFTEPSPYTQLEAFNSPGAAGSDLVWTWTNPAGVAVTNLMFRISASYRGGANPSPTGSITVKRVTLRGIGVNPFGFDNCGA